MSIGINLIMPMAGSGSRYIQSGYHIPKPLLKINDRPFFYWATQSINKYVDLKSLTFVVLKEHIERYQIDHEIKCYYPNASIRVLDEVLNGAVLTCLEGIKGICNDNPIVFNDCDHIFECKSFYNYCNSGNSNEIDGALLTFKSNDPKYSFLAYDEFGNVTRTVEKQVISSDAICGAYYFKNKKIFKESALEYLKTCSYKEYFMSGVYNIVASQGLIIKGFNVDNHIPFGTPDEYTLAVQHSSKFEELK